MNQRTKAAVAATSLTGILLVTSVCSALPPFAEGGKEGEIDMGVHFVGQLGQSQPTELSSTLQTADIKYLHLGAGTGLGSRPLVRCKVARPGREKARDLADVARPHQDARIRGQATNRADGPQGGHRIVQHHRNVPGTFYPHPGQAFRTRDIAIEERLASQTGAPNPIGIYVDHRMRDAGATKHFSQHLSTDAIAKDDHMVAQGVRC